MSDLAQVLAWPMLISPCQHSAITVGPTHYGTEIMYVCTFCGPIKVKWPEYR